MKTNALNVLLIGVLSAAFFAAGCAGEASSSAAQTSAATPSTPAPASATNATNAAIIVTLSDERPMSDVVVDLQKQGFEVDRAMENIGSVSGHISAGSIDKLKAVPGVGAVEREVVFAVD